MEARRVEYIPDSCRAVGKAARDKGMTVYAVGGAVRSALLGMDAKDIDLCGPDSAADLRGIEDEYISVTDPVNGLGTAIIASQGDRFEYTAFRRDSYAKGGAHTPEQVTFTRDIRQDAARRDFTVNALYADLETGEILDPLGRGVEDLEARVLRMVRPDTMEEDALRILRLVRFASQLGFEIDRDTWEAAKQNIPHLENISAERIRDELCGILLSDVTDGRTGAPARGLMMLRDLGALRHIIPALEDGRGFIQSSRYHRYDVLDHQIASSAAAPPEITTRLAALLHDVAKPEVFREDGNMYRHAEAGAEKAVEIMKALRVPQDIARDAAELIRYHMFDLDNTAKESTVRKYILKLGPRQFSRLADLREADFAGSGMGSSAPSADKWRRVLAQMNEKNAPFCLHDLAVSGNDLMREFDMKPGPEIGWLLGELLARAAARPSQNNYKSLLNYAKMLKDGAPRVPARPHGRTVTEDLKGV